MPLLLPFSLNLFHHGMILLQVDLFSSAKAYGKQNCFDVALEAVVRGTIPQDPGS